MKKFALTLLLIASLATHSCAGLFIVRARSPFITTVNVAAGFPSYGFGRVSFGSYGFNGYGGYNFAGYGFPGYGFGGYGYGVGYPVYPYAYYPPPANYAAPTPCAPTAPTPAAYAPPPAVTAPAPQPVYQAYGYSYVPALGYIAPIYSYGGNFFYRFGGVYGRFFGTEIFSTHALAVTHFAGGMLPGGLGRAAVNIAAIGKAQPQKVVATRTVVRKRR